MEVTTALIERAEERAGAEGYGESAPEGQTPAPGGDPTRDNQEHELEAEQESAAAMDSEAPQPSGASETTE